MKSKSTKRLGLLSACVVASVVMVASACDFTFRSTEIERFEIDATNAKTAYLEGEEFSPEGLWMLVYYEDGTSAEVTSGYYIAPPSLRLTPEETEKGEDVVTREVSVTYGLAKGTYEITLEAFKGLEFEGGQRSFTQGEAFTAEGLTVYELYGGGTRVPAGEYEIVSVPSEDDMNTPGTYAVTVSYEKWNIVKQYSYEITVVDNGITGFELVTEDVQQTFFVGDTFNHENLKIKLLYEGGRTSVLESGFRVDFSQVDMAHAGTYPVEVTYGGFAAKSYQIEVVEPAVVRIEVVDGSYVREYFEGESFDPAGLRIKVFFDDPKKAPEEVSYTENGPIAVTAPDMNAVGEQTGSVEYSGKRADFTVTVNPIEVESIEVVSGPTGVFYENDEFDPTGLRIEVSYNKADKEHDFVTYSEGGALQVVSLPDMSKAGTQTGTVEYMGKRADFTVTVREVVLESIEITGLPNKQDYDWGEAFVAEGLAVTAHYNNHDEVLSEGENGYTLTAPSTVAKGLQNGMVAFGRFTEEFTVTVYDVPDHLEVSIGKTYVEGNIVAKDDLTVEVVYKSNEKAAVTEFTFAVSPAGALEAGESYTVTVNATVAAGEYTRGGTVSGTCEIAEVKEAAVEKISVLNAGEITEGKLYNREDTEGYDFTGLRILLEYNNGTETTITYDKNEESEITFEFGDPTEQNTRAVTVVYNGTVKTTVPFVIDVWEYALPVGTGDIANNEATKRSPGVWHFFYSGLGASDEAYFYNNSVTVNMARISGSTNWFLRYYPKFDEQTIIEASFKVSAVADSTVYLRVGWGGTNEYFELTEGENDISVRFRLNGTCFSLALTTASGTNNYYGGALQMKVSDIRFEKSIMVTDAKDNLVKSASIDLATGNTLQLKAASSLEGEVEWSSDKPEVATVADGLVTAHTEGTAIITAKVGEKVASCVVEVVDSSENFDEYEVPFGTYSDALSAPGRWYMVDVNNFSSSYANGQFTVTSASSGAEKSFTVFCQPKYAVGTKYTVSITIARVDATKSWGSKAARLQYGTGTGYSADNKNNEKIVTEHEDELNGKTGSFTFTGEFTVEADTPFFFTFRCAVAPYLVTINFEPV